MTIRGQGIDQQMTNQQAGVCNGGIPYLSRGQSMASQSSNPAV